MGSRSSVRADVRQGDGDAMGQHASTRDGLDQVIGRMRSRRVAMTREELVGLIGRRAVDAGLDERRLVRVLPGVFAPADLASDHRVRCHAAALAGRGRLVIAGQSALHLADAQYSAPTKVEALVPAHGYAPSAPWLWTRSVSFITEPPGLRGRVTLPPADAAVDAWARVAPRDRKAVLYDTMWLGLARPAAIAAACDRRLKVPQRAALLEILSEFDEGAQSPGEVMARREVFRHSRYDEFERQVPIVAGGRRRPIDMLHRRAKLAVEIDSDRYHGSPDAVARDQERDVELAALGFMTVRYRYRQLRDRPAWCRDTLDRTVASRLASLA